MLADYHKECELAETLREKSDVQLKHARLIREALRQPPVSGELADFARFLSEEYSIEIHQRIIDEWDKYYSANYG